MARLTEADATGAPGDDGVNAGSDLPEHVVVLPAVKHAARRLRRSPAAMPDRVRARRPAQYQAGTEKRTVSTKPRNTVSSTPYRTGVSSCVVRGSISNVAGHVRGNSGQALRELGYRGLEARDDAYAMRLLEQEADKRLL